MEYTTSNECQELKNIKYKSMLLNGVSVPEIKSSNDLTNLDKFLQNEKNNNDNEPWCKMNKTIKIQKINNFVENYKTTNKLSCEEAELLSSFLKDCIDRKKLSRVKDVVYDKENGIIIEIPALHYIKTTKHFTLKNLDKRISTLKSLTPKKTNQGTIRKKDKSKQINYDSDEDNEP